MSIRRTKKSYARSAIDLCLEQTVNKYAASPWEALLLSETQKVLAGGGVSLLPSVVWLCQSSLKLLIFNQGRNLLNSIQSVEFGMTMLTWIRSPSPWTRHVIHSPLMLLLKSLTLLQRIWSSQKNKIRKVNAAEGVRDVVMHLTYVMFLDPITEVPLSLAHSDGTLLKTDKATLTKTLESRQETVKTYLSLPQIWWRFLHATENRSI